MKRPLVFLPFLLLISLLTGCTAHRTASPELYQTRQEAYVDSSPKDRKLLYAAELGLTVESPDSAVSQIIAIAQEVGGFLSQTTNTTAEVRVPAAQLEDALARIQSLGKTRYRNVRTQDVTEAYRDYAVRLDNAKKSRLRYLELLAKASNVEETLLVERELERLAESIDLLQGQINLIDQMEAFSSITVALQQRAKLGPLGYVFKGLYDGVKWLFVRK